MNTQKRLDDQHTHTSAYIKWSHVDGPMLRCSDGTVHFLSMFERFMFMIGMYTVTSLDFMYGRH